MTDEEIKALAFKHCYATTTANGYIFHADFERGLKPFVDAIRDQALEEAAKIALQYEEGSGGAEAIRALKDKNA